MIASTSFSQICQSSSERKLQTSNLRRTFLLRCSWIVLLCWLSGSALPAQSASDLYEQSLAAIEAKDYEQAKALLFQSLKSKPEYPEAFLALGKVYEAFGDDDTALKGYGRAISLNDRLFEAYFSYGQIAMKRDNPRLAWQVYSRVIQLDPKNSRAYALRAEVLLPFVAYLALQDYDKAIKNSDTKSKEIGSLYQGRGKAYYAQHRWVDAEADYRLAIKSNPRNGAALVGLGRSLLRQGKYRAAKPVLSEARRYESDDPYVYAGLAACEAAAGREEPARKYFDEAFGRDSDIAELYWRRAQFEQQFSQLDEAEQDYNQAVELAPKDFEVYQLRGLFFQYTGRYQEALDDYNKGIRQLNANLFKGRKGEKLDETELLLLFQYQGDVLFLLEKYNEAMRAYQTLLKREVKNPDVYIGIGNIQVATSLYKEALASYNQAVALAPEKGPGSAKPRYLRGSAKAQIGQVDVGMKDIQTAIKLERKNANAYYYQGLVYAKQNDYVSAEISLQNAVRYAKYNPQYYYTLALIQYHLEASRKVLNTLEALVELVPDYSGVYSLRAKAKYQLGLMDEALEDAESGLQEDPKDVELYIVRAHIHEEQEQNDLALEDYRLALQVLPNSAIIYRDRALLQNKLGKPELALADIDKAISLEPEDADNLFTKGILLAENERREEGLTAMDKALELDKSRNDLRLQRANLQIKLGLYKEARIDLQKVLAEDNSNPQANFLQGYLAFLSGDYATARASMDVAYLANPTDKTLAFNYAQVLVTMGQTNKALRLFKQLLEDDKYRPQGRYGLAIISLYKKRYDEALDLFDAAIQEEDKPEPQAYIGRGSALLKLLNYNAAIRDFQYYLDNYGDNYQAWRFMGDARRLLGNLDPAYEAYQKAVDLNPDDAMSYYGRGMVLLSNENLDLALADLDKAIQMNKGQAEFYVSRGKVKLAKNNVRGALTDAKQALRYNSKLAEAYSLQADIYTKQGNESAASKARTKYETLSGNTLY